MDVPGFGVALEWSPKNLSCSPDGRYVAFMTARPLNETPDNGAEDVYVRDLLHPEVRPFRIGQQAQIVRQHAMGGVGNATKLVYIEGANVYVQGIANGAPVGAPVKLNGQSIGTSATAAISTDGTYVAFSSVATDLYPSDNNHVSDIFLANLATLGTQCISLGAGGTTGNAGSNTPIVSSGGQSVLFQSSATDLPCGTANDGWYLWTRSGTMSQVEDLLGDGCYLEASGDGRFLAYGQYGADGSVTSLWLYDRQNPTARTCVSNRSSEYAGTASTTYLGEPVVSNDGRFVVFIATSDVGDAGIVPSPNSHEVGAVCVHDRVTGETTLASYESDGQQGYWCWSPAISADGRTVAFISNNNYFVLPEAPVEMDLFEEAFAVSRNQADALIRAGSGSFIGAGICSDTGATEQVSGKVAPGGTLSYTVRLQNTYLVDPSFRLHGTSGEHGWTVRYFDPKNGDTEITEAVTSQDGWAVPSLNGDTPYDIRIEVTAPSWLRDPMPLTTRVTLWTPNRPNRDSSDTVSAVTSGQPRTAFQNSAAPRAGAINLFTGELEYTGGADIAVTNPEGGPDVSFTRTYYSALAAAGHASPGLSAGWVHNYDYTVTPDGWADVTLIHPDGTREHFAVVGTPASSSTVDLAPDYAGAPYRAKGVTGATTGSWTSISLVGRDRTTWDFEALQPGESNTYVLRRVTDGGTLKGITLEWDPSTRRLQRIRATGDQTVLLEAEYGLTGGLISAVHDRLQSYSVAYGETTLNGYTGALLGTVSYLNETGMASRGTRWTYEYRLSGSQPMLNCVKEKSPYDGRDNISTMTALFAGDRVDEQSDANGHRTKFFYNAGSTKVERYAKEATTPSTCWTQLFDNQGRDIGTIDAGGVTTAITYDPVHTHLPQTVTGKDGLPTVYQYDTYGHVTRVTDPTGAAIGYAYSTKYTSYPEGLLEKVTEYAADGGPSRTSGFYVYYDQTAAAPVDGRLKEAWLPSPGTGNVPWPADQFGASGTECAGLVKHAYAYDVNGNLLSETHPSDDPAMPATTTYANYILPGCPETVTDALNHSTVYQYNTLGQVTRVIDALQRAAVTEYDTHGRVTSETGPDGSVTSYAYNPDGKQVTVTLPNSHTGLQHGGKRKVEAAYPGGAVRTESLYDESDSMVPAAFYVQTNTYGQAGELKESADGNVANKVVYTYDEFYRPLTAKTGNQNATVYAYTDKAPGQNASVTITGPSGAMVQRFYDRWDRLDRTVKNGQTITPVYDTGNFGRRLKRIQLSATTYVEHSYDPVWGRVCGTETRDDGNIVDRTVIEAFDPTDRPTKTTDTKGGVTRTVTQTYTLAGSPCTTTDEDGTTTATFDALGRQRMVSLPSGGTVSHNYDAVGRPSQLIEGNGSEDKTTTFEYKAGTDLVQYVKYPMHDATKLTDVDTKDYDGLGRVVMTVDGTGKACTYGYERLSLTRSITYPATPAESRIVVHDAQLRPKTVKATNDVAWEEYSYDDDDSDGLQPGDGGYLRWVTTNFGTFTKTIQYTTNPADGSRATMAIGDLTGTGANAVFSASHTFTYGYDNGRLERVGNPFGHTSSWAYDWDGVIKEQTLANGVYTSYERTPLERRLTALRTNKGAYPGGEVRSAYTGITYDWKDRLTGFDASVPGFALWKSARRFTYDGEGRLKTDNIYQAPGMPDTDIPSYGYDEQGGILDTPRSEFDPLHDSLPRHYNLDNQWDGYTNSSSVDGMDAFRYDADGNPTRYKGRELRYDTNSRLTEYWGAGVVPSAELNPVFKAGYRDDGKRLWKEVRGNNGAGAPVKTYYLYDGDQIVAELDAAGTVTAVNTWGANGLLERHDARGDVFYAFDPLGNVAQRLDDAGNVLSSDEYDAYGNLVTGGDAADPYGYKAQFGYYTDHETGLILCTYRYYDPAAGRWLTRDPIRHAGGLNLYEYCGGDPEGGVDPSGLDELGLDELVWYPGCRRTTLAPSCGIFLCGDLLKPIPGHTGFVHAALPSAIWPSWVIVGADGAKYGNGANRHDRGRGMNRRTVDTAVSPLWPPPSGAFSRALSCVPPRRGHRQSGLPGALATAGEKGECDGWHTTRLSAGIRCP